MFAFSWLRQLQRRWFGRRAIRHMPVRAVRPCLEVLEDRTAPAVLTVNSTLDNNATDVLTLREAVQVVNSGSTAGLSAQQLAQINTTQPLGTNDTIVFDPTLTASGPATITLTSGELDITKDLTIQGPGANLLTVSGNHASRVFQLTPGGTHNFTFSGLTIADGIGDFGGGMNLGGTSGTLTIQDCVFSGNNASDIGGGLQVFGNSSATIVNITNTTFTNNQASDTPAADFGNCTATLTNCTISGNTASSADGGLLVLAANNAQTSDLTLINCTIAANSTPSFASGLEVFTQGGATSATARYVNTIFANSASGSPNISADGLGASVTSLGHNLSDDGSGNLNAAGDLPNTNPLLASLGNYGGSEPTMALLPGSPAIDAGTAASGVTTDERGVTRPQGSAPDLGAFESQGFMLAVKSGANQSTPIITAFTSPLVVTVTAVDGVDPVAGGQLTFTAPSGGASATLSPANPVTIASNGTASVTATANGTAGSYDVTANTAGALASTAFRLTNVGATTTAASNATATFSESAQNVTLSATVSSGAGAVNEGTVTFTLKQGSTIIGTATTSTTVSNGHASVSYALPAGSAAGAYTIDVGYNPGHDFTTSSDTTHTLTVAPAAAAIQFTSVSVAPNLLALNQTETFHVHVSGANGVVNAGTVTFTVDGKNVSAAVNGNGDATANFTLPLPTTAFSQSIEVAFSGPNRLPATATQTALWGPINTVMSSVATFTADSGQSVQSFLIGLPLLDFLYTAEGQLTKVIFGPDLLSWNFSYFGVLTVVTLDGVLPVMVLVSTPQGQLLGTVTPTV
jgi:hypothetical protein